MARERYSFLSKLKEDAICSNKKHSEQLIPSPGHRAESPVRYSKNFTKEDLAILGSVIAESDEEHSDICFELPASSDSMNKVQNDDNRYVTGSSCADTETRNDDEAASKFLQMHDETIRTVSPVPACSKTITHSPVQATLNSTESPLLTPSTINQLINNVQYDMYDSPNLSSFIADQIMQLNNVNSSTLSPLARTSQNINDIPAYESPDQLPFIDKQINLLRGADSRPVTPPAPAATSPVSAPTTLFPLMAPCTSQNINDIPAYESPDQLPFIDKQINLLRGADSRPVTPPAPAATSPVSAPTTLFPLMAPCTSQNINDIPAYESPDQLPFIDKQINLLRGADSRPVTPPAPAATSPVSAPTTLFPLMAPCTSQNINDIPAYESPDQLPFTDEQINLLRGADSRPVTPPAPAATSPVSRPTVNIRVPEITEFRSAELEGVTDRTTDQPFKKKRIRNNVPRDTSKKRTLNKSQWVDTQRKDNKNRGKMYKSRDGKVRQQRIMGSICKSTCKQKCLKKITETQRRQLFDKFWSMGDLVRQWDFIARYCHKIQKRRITTESESRRQYTIKYFLSTKTDNDPNSKTQVCKVTFLNTFGIKQGFVYSAINKLMAENTILQDQRGRHNNHKKIVTSAMTTSVCDHVKSFAPVESHYVRSRSNKLYLHESLSVARMFLLYIEWVDPESREKVKTCRQYRDIVNSNFNLGFHIPKKDMCDVCHAHDNLPKPNEEEEYIAYSTHIRNKNIARELKCKDKEHSIQDKTVLTAVYDFQKVHGLPYGETSILYYKRKLTVFNFTVFDMGTKTAKCFVWDETIAKRGANEVASCLYDYIEENALRGVKKFNFWSDNCGGQNRNRIVFAGYLRAAKHFNVIITHKYLEKGHTQNEGDSVHALIERTAKHKVVYTPEQWYALIRWAKQDKNPYIVIEMTTTDFIDFKMLLPECNWTVDTDGNKMFWSHLKQLQIFPDSAEKIDFKTDFCDHEFKSILILNNQENPKTRSRLRNKVVVENSQLPFHTRRLQQAYEGKLSLPKAKLQDLHYLCSHNIIPNLYHNFYMNLKEGGVNIANDEEED